MDFDSIELSPFYVASLNLQSRIRQLECDCNKIFVPQQFRHREAKFIVIVTAEVLEKSNIGLLWKSNIEFG